MEVQNRPQAERDADALQALRTATEVLRRLRPGDRSNRDRWYQITITDMEKTVGSFFANVVDGETAT